jgi:hypothetical protein
MDGKSAIAVTVPFVTLVFLFATTFRALGRMEQRLDLVWGAYCDAVRRASTERARRSEGAGRSLDEGEAAADDSDRG